MRSPQIAVDPSTIVSAMPSVWTALINVSKGNQEHQKKKIISIMGYYYYYLQNRCKITDVAVVFAFLRSRNATASRSRS